MKDISILFDNRCNIVYS